MTIVEISIDQQMTMHRDQRMWLEIEGSN